MLSKISSNVHGGFLYTMVNLEQYHALTTCIPYSTQQMLSQQMLIGRVTETLPRVEIYFAHFQVYTFYLKTT